MSDKYSRPKWKRGKLSPVSAQLFMFYFFFIISRNKNHIWHQFLWGSRGDWDCPWQPLLWLHSRDGLQLTGNHCVITLGTSLPLCYYTGKNSWHVWLFLVSFSNKLPYNNWNRPIWWCNMIKHILVLF